MCQSVLTILEIESVKHTRYTHDYTIAKQTDLCVVQFVVSCKFR